MPTPVTSTIIPGGGGDFTTLNGWEGDNEFGQRILTTMERAVCSNFAGGSFTAREALSFTGGAAGVMIEEDGSSFMRYQLTSGTPVDTDTITGDVSGATCDIDSFAYQDGEEAEAECHADGTADPTAVTIAGWTTDATRFIRVYANAGDEAQMPFATPSNAYTLDNNVETLTIQEEYVRIERIQIENDTTSAGNRACVVINAGSTAEIRFIGCFIRHSAVSAGTFWVMREFSNSNVFLINCVFQGDGSGTTETGCLIEQGGNVAYVYNCTAIECTVGFAINAGGRIKNCLAVDNTTDFSGTPHADSTNNGSEDDTALGSNPQSEGTFGFVDASGDDYHGDGTGDAIGNGADLSGDSDFAFDGDFDTAIDGGIRSAWDIGADEFIAAADHVFPDRAHRPQHQAVMAR